jgi:hypothetical protein
MKHLWRAGLACWLAWALAHVVPAPYAAAGALCAWMCIYIRETARTIGAEYARADAYEEWGSE